MPDFFKNAKNNLNEVIEACRRSREGNAELLIVNFELRSKHYLALIGEKQGRLLAQKSEIPDELNDDLFGRLFLAVIEDMKQGEHDGFDGLDPTGGRRAAHGAAIGQMQIYTSQFMKYLIKILQRGKHYLQLEAINNTIKQLLLSDKLVIVANTMPLFTMAQMFTLPEHEERTSLKENKEIIDSVYELIERQIAVQREKQTRAAQPLLHYYKVRNIIFAYTCLLQFHLCRALNLGKATDGKIPLDPEKSKSFIVRKQRRCNFCGHHLDQPQSFAFSVKCQNCSLRNSTLVIPTGLVCDACTDSQARQIFVSEKLNVYQGVQSMHGSSSERSDEQGAETPTSVRSASLIDSIQSVITSSLQLFMAQIQGEKERKTLCFFTNAYDSIKEDKKEPQVNNLASCLSKVEGSSHLHNHLVFYLVMRMMKVLESLLGHEVQVHEQSQKIFVQIQEVKDEFGDAFSLLKDRIGSVADEMELQGLTRELLESEQIGGGNGTAAEAADKQMADETTAAR